MWFLVKSIVGWAGQEQHKHIEEADNTKAEETAKTSAKETDDDEPAVDWEAARNYEPAATYTEHAAMDDEPTDNADNDDSAAQDTADPGLGLPAWPADQAVDLGQGERRRRKEKRRNRRRKRRRKKKDKYTIDMSIVLTNCKGYGSKEESIKKDIVEQLAPEVILLN